MKKYKESILYLIFGALTTVVNIVGYYVFYHLLNVGNVPSAVIAWTVSVLFAFATNRKFVFASQSNGVKSVICEITTFFVCRFLTGTMDVGIMWFAVDVMAFNSLLWKIISNVLVIVLNYFASKIFVFKKKIK